MYTSIDSVFNAVGLELQYRGTKPVCPLCKSQSAFKVFEGDSSSPPSFNCFKCSKSGNGYDLVAAVKGITNKEAFQLVNNTKVNKSQQRLFMSSTQFLDRVWEFYQKEAKNNQLVKDYLTQRGLEKIAYKVGVGYSPPGGLLKATFRDTELEKYGLLSKSKQELLTNRVIFAYKDEQGRVMQLQGRSLDKDNPVRWLSTYCPSTKGINDCLYNIDSLYSLSSEKEEVIYICEGVTDCLSLLSVGLKAVSTAGIKADLTKHHLVLKDKKLIAAYDFDQELEGESEIREYKSWSSVLPTLSKLYKLREQTSTNNSISALWLDSDKGTDINEWMLNCLSAEQFYKEVKNAEVPIETFAFSLLKDNSYYYSTLIRLLSIKRNSLSQKLLQRLSNNVGGYLNLLYYLVDEDDE